MVEIVGGAGVYLLVAAWPWALVRLILATAASAVYEAVLDANGWSWADVGQRQAVIGLVELVRHMAESWVGV